MGFFTNAGASKDGEIVLSSDHRHLYRIMEGKFVELKKDSLRLYRTSGNLDKNLVIQYMIQPSELCMYII